MDKVLSEGVSRGASESMEVLTVFDYKSTLLYVSQIRCKKFP